MLRDGGRTVQSVLQSCVGAGCCRCHWCQGPGKLPGAMAPHRPLPFAMHMCMQSGLAQFQCVVVAVLEGRSSSISGLCPPDSACGVCLHSRSCHRCGGAWSGRTTRTPHGRQHRWTACGTWRPSRPMQQVICAGAMTGLQSAALYVQLPYTAVTYNARVLHVLHVALTNSLDRTPARHTSTC
jgi:hypothetical protein